MALRTKSDLARRGISWDIPAEFLCPPVPGRLAYIRWIHALLAAIEYEGPVSGIDIGTGASCIYPLLGCSEYPTWSFLATEMDWKAYVVARGNVERNVALRDRIRIVHVNGQSVFPKRISDDSFAFSMCNPPFYASKNEVLEKAAFKHLLPKHKYPGAEHEMMVDKGEVGFISNMIAESVHLKTSVQWFTTLVGIKSSLAKLIPLVLKHTFNYTVVSVQPGKTRRWILAWSFFPRRPTALLSKSDVYLETIAQHLGQKRKRQSENEVVLFQHDRVFQTSCCVYETQRILENVCKLNLNVVSVVWTTVSCTVFVSNIWTIVNNAWSRKSRRQRLDVSKTVLLPIQHEATTDVDTFQVQIAIQGKQHQSTQVRVRWIQGLDRDMFRRCVDHLETSIKANLLDRH